MDSAAKLLWFVSQQNHSLIMPLAKILKHSWPRDRNARKTKMCHRLVIWIQWSNLCKAFHVINRTKVCACSVTSNTLWPHCGPPSKNTGVDYHFLLQRIFLTQGSNPRLQHWQADSLPLAPPRKPRRLGKCWLSCIPLITLLLPSVRDSQLLEVL